MLNGLDAISPPPTATVMWRGEARNVYPLKIGQLPAFARAVSPLADHITAMLAGGTVTPGIILGMIGEHGEKLIEAVAIATGIERAEIEQADAAELLQLIPPVIQANRDFLVGRLGTALQAARSATAMPGTGQTSAPT